LSLGPAPFSHNEAMHPALLALLVLVAPPTAAPESFRFGIRPKIDVEYRYRQTLSVTGEMNGSDAGDLKRVIEQSLGVVRKNKYGFEILMATDSVDMTFPQMLKIGPEQEKEIESKMVDKLVLGATFDAAGRLKNYVTYTEEDHQKLADDMATVCFGFVLQEMHSKPMKVGDAFTAPFDTSMVESRIDKATTALDPAKPKPKSVWTLTAITRKGSRYEALFRGKLTGKLEFVGVDGAKPPVDRVALTVDATAVYDVASGMLISSESTAGCQAAGPATGKDSRYNMQSRLKNRVELLNPKVL
jgi:hypothetical protein